jgi:hypothetical protein
MASSPARQLKAAGSPKVFQCRMGTDVYFPIISWHSNHTCGGWVSGGSNAMLRTNLAAGFFIALAISPAIGQVRGCQKASKPKAAAALCLKAPAEKRAIAYAEAAPCAKAAPPACEGSCESGMCRVTYDGNFKQICSCAH